jgi:PhzF family phenazine biosynthesis protein
MTPYQFHQLDVFSNQPLKGNPLAVVHGAADLSTSAMADFASWTNLSETTFLLPPTDPQADYQVRIFTPGKELPFAGHPTLGSCYAWLAKGGQPKNPPFIIQECGIGLVKIRQHDDRLAFAAPALSKTGELDEAMLHQIALGLGLHRSDILLHQWVDNGPGWCVVMLESAEKVLSLQLNGAHLAPFKLGVIGPCSAGADTDFEVRAFVLPYGITEDPVTGSLNAGIAKWLIGAGLAPSHYIVSQGTALRRRGRVFIDQDGDDIWIGGEVTICIEGNVTM